ncbi:MAG: DUF1592 domain-containing protein, partial [Saprospiraceae bacterium]
MKKELYILSFFLILAGHALAIDSFSYETHVRPLLEKSCIKCHNTNRPKADVNIDNYKEQDRVIKDGAFWLKIRDVIKSGSMPPKTEPKLSMAEYDQLVNGIDKVLKSSLEKKTPGAIVIRRLSHAEYHYTVLDLLHVDFNAKDFFPSDGSGGGGFDNQGRALFLTPLKLERYFDAADQIVDSVYQNKENWNRWIDFKFDPSGWTGIKNWFRSFFNPKYADLNNPEKAAEIVITPLATKAYRRFLKEDDKQHLVALFKEVYDQKTLVHNPQRFEESIAQVMKAILVSPNFLYKTEEESNIIGPFPLSHFEVANRLSYFLWCSMPDQELFDLAYKGKLHDTLVLTQQVKRMLADPRSKRFAENFAVQWLGITKLLDHQPMVDEGKFPGFDMKIRKALYDETVEYFYHVLTQSKNMLDLIQSDYAMLNKNLAIYYGIEGVENEDIQKITVSNGLRGGVLGMGSVLSVTSLSLRTSPVLRGKWVMEQLLGISPPPPPPVVAELTSDPAKHEALGLRKILEMHRSKPECKGCHEKMDPLGLGLENFDPIGKWRTTYEKVPIDASGVTVDGKKFKGPTELKTILMDEKQKIARNFA